MRGMVEGINNFSINEKNPRIEITETILQDRHG